MKTIIYNIKWAIILFVRRIREFGLHPVFAFFC